MSRSLADIVALQPQAVQREWYEKISPSERAALQYRWDFWARPNQIEPVGDDWLTWLILCGRSWGKTKTGAEWIRSNVCGKTPLAAGPGRHQFIAIIAETAADARDVLVEGPAGILRCHPKEFRPEYESSKRRLTWPNGAQATLFNGTEPDQLRGPQQSLAWCDELCKYQFAGETLDMLDFGMRLVTETKPRKLITTTPRPMKLLKALIEDPRTAVTRGSLYENRANLDSDYVQSILDKFEGTRLGRQELHGEIVDDVPGALWTRATIDEKRLKKATPTRDADPIPEMQRLIVAIDPAAKASDEGDETSETGIIVAGVGTDGRGYVIDDLSCRLGPSAWAKLAVSAYDRYEADYIVAEINQGGDMVEALIKAVRPTIKVEKVRATRGKVVRAEPIAALYDQGRISHHGQFPILEDQMVMFTPFGIQGDEGSDRVDALVWAFTRLFEALTKRERKPKRESGRPTGMGGRSEVTGY